jgi:hypothetical protein
MQKCREPERNGANKMENWGCDEKRVKLMVGRKRANG